MTSLEYYIEQIEQFISALTDDIKSGEGTVVTQTKLAVYREVLEHLEEIEQEPKTGHWILTSDDDYEYCTCSECGYQNGENWMIGSQIKYCQECGAKMVEPQERSDKE